MSTIACPACSEIIPNDVDYCPFCGKSTRITAQTIMTDDDIAVAERLAAIAASNTTGDAPVNSALKLPPEAGERVCLMCLAKPPTMGDYCLECHQKLELGPEQWDLLKQDQAKVNGVVLMGAGLAVLALALMIVHILHHH
jgi:RNA polymerase subunit RPABC4/transcription elongation factor Spt4